jgi:hypothetical protein
MIVDREGMATEFLASLHAEGRHVVTILLTKIMYPSLRVEIPEFKIE